ncbi:hypothetical protein QBC38DRAFT_344402, partial [Podospora fimiseda]
MTLVHNLSEHRVRVLLDTGSQIPVVSLYKAREWNLPVQRRTEPRLILAFNKTPDEAGGQYFTDYLVLRHQENHCTRLSFELTDMDDECDVILPQWWMAQHQPSNLFGRPEEIAFESVYC